MGLRARNRLILVKRESIYATDPTPAPATDAVLIRSLNPQPLQQQTVDRTLVRGHYGAFEKLPTMGMVSLEIEMELAGFGTAGPATPTPGYDALLRACGFAQTVDPGVSVTYTPVSTGFESCTIYFYQDGTLHKAVGCRGTVTLALTKNEIPVYRFQMQGLFQPVLDVPLPAPNFAAYQQPRVVNSQNTTGVSLHGFANACLSSLEVSLNNQLVHRNLVNCTEEMLITDRQPAGRMVIEATTVAAKDWYAAVRTAALGALAISHGPATNRVSIAGGVVQVTEPSFEEEDGIVMLSLGLQFVPTSAGNDELTLTID
ncbi:MAG: phage tail tube protein [Sinimarinibacterium flocculans]|uniref:phage tail tube protein n=1 Tax=Sinimarinibacterium flocculans TaxID=985250 RepID=UPI003C663497